MVLAVRLRDRKHFTAEAEGLLTSTEGGERALNNKLTG